MNRAANPVFRLSLVLLTCLFSSAAVFGQSDCRIIITTPGYGSIYRYAPEEFAAQMASDFKIEGVTVNYATLSEGCKRLKLHIGRKDFVFSITPQSPVARLTYDRNPAAVQGDRIQLYRARGRSLRSSQFQGPYGREALRSMAAANREIDRKPQPARGGQAERIPARSRYRRAGQRTQDSRAERGAPAIFSDIHRQTVRHGCQRVAAGEEGRRAVPYGMPVEVRADAVVELYDTVVRPPGIFWRPFY